MIRKKIFRNIFIALAIALAMWFVFIYTITSKKHTANSEAEVYITSSELVNAYISDENEADANYAEKLIKVTGILSEITYLNNRNTIILKDEKSSSGIICELDKRELSKLSNLKTGQKIKVLGICKGFLKDVVLLNCYVETDE